MQLKGSFTVLIDDEEFVVDLEDLQADLKIDSANIRKELERQPGMFAWIASLAAQSDYELGQLKQGLVGLKAGLAKQLREEDIGKKRFDRLSNDAVEECVLLDEDVRTLSDEYLEVARKAAIMNAFREAARQRSQALYSLAALERGEMHFSSTNE